MIRVIVVDDEKTIREGIARFIQESEGFEVLVICENGVTAYNAIVEKNPDLVICDIIMPQCDGIELISKCREQNISCEFVLLSGYSEFEYARSAIRYGVLDYVNKPINPAALKLLLKNAAKIIESKNHIKKKLQFNIYDKLIDSESIPAESSEEYEFTSGLSHRVLVINAAKDQKSFEQTEDTEKMLTDCEKILKKMAHEQYIIYKKNGLIILILVGKDTNGHTVQKICTEIFCNTREKGAHAAIGIGDAVRELQKIPESFFKANAALYEAQCSNMKKCFFESLPYAYADPAGICAEDFFNVANSILLKDEELVLAEVKKTVSRLKKSQPPYVVYSFVIKCANELIRSWGETTKVYKIRRQKERLVQLETAGNMELLMKRFTELAVSEYEAIANAKNVHYGGTIDEVIRYIHLHYTQDISVEKICNVFYFNQSYFSSLFKSKTGCNYNDYITNLRINKAKDLLKSGNYKVSEIADLVGYNSPRYFSRVFKKKTGELPQEYKLHYLTKP